MNYNLKAITILLRSFNSLAEVLKQDISNYDLNTTEFGVLEFIYHKGKQPINNLCQRLLMANSSMTYVVDQLVKKGYVTRVADTVDKRITNIELTKNGEEFITTIFPNHEKRINEIFEVLTEEEVTTLMGLLKKVGYHSVSLVEKKSK